MTFQFWILRSSMTNVPRVSVLIPVYNGEDYVGQAVQSILDQTYSDLEVVVVDDGSTDSTLAILQEMQSDKRIKVVSRPNTGIVGALNDGLAIARGDYIARMDADDIAFPTRIAKQVAFLDRHQDVVIAGSMWINISAQGELASLRGEEFTHTEIERALLQGKGAAMMHPTVVIRSSALEQIGVYRRQYQHAEDYDLFLRLAEIGRLGNLREPLLYRRVHAGSICAQRQAEQQELKRQVLRETATRRKCEIECDHLSWSNRPRTRAQRAFNAALSAKDKNQQRRAIREATVSALLRPWRTYHWQPLLSLLGKPTTIA